MDFESRPLIDPARKKKTSRPASTGVLAALFGALAALLLLVAAAAPARRSQKARSEAGKPFARAVVEKVYYINLDGDADRRAAVEAAFASTAPDTPVERVAAVGATTGDDFGGELGAYIVSAYEGRCPPGCEASGNAGLCCLAGLDGGGSVAAAQLADEAYGCVHYSSHAGDAPHAIAATKEETHRACCAFNAGWASRLKALDAIAADFGNAGDDAHVLLVEDDAVPPPGWLEALAASDFAPPGTWLDDAASTRDAAEYDYIRVDADRASGSRAYPTGAHVLHMVRALPAAYAAPAAAEITRRFDDPDAPPPPPATFVYGCGALLIRANRAAKIRAALPLTVRDIDIGLNILTWLGELQVAALAAPVIGNDGLAFESSIRRRLGHRPF